MSYIWPDQALRVARTQAAIKHILPMVPDIEEVDAVSWLLSHLKAQQESRVRIFCHSIIWQYFSKEEQKSFIEAMKKMALSASESTPFA